MGILPSLSTSSGQMQELVSGYTHNLNLVLQQLNVEDLSKLVQMLLAVRANRRTLYICGNGGSAGNAVHLANDFTYGINPKGRSLDVEALAANTSVLTCLGNDIGYENVFAHQVKVKAQEGDILIVLSGSGNSENIIQAINQAKELGVYTVGILGYDGGKAKPLVDLAFHFDINDMQISEDTQVVLGHILMKALYKELANVDS